MQQENRMCIGNKKIYHLEAWVVKVMSLYKVSLHQLLRYNPGIDWFGKQQFFLGIELGDFDDLI